ncbi:phosphatase PAP2 family protein [Jatrophihabitans sp.]|uniref:phosphatase PAP2 family protein n=1 Tax=Jatrophihabitans sp. TaxID=1932789 RepID=UPI002BBC7521|nr:phosphatase PAP2 family protein [Jatrophihabitans sp.]
MDTMIAWLADYLLFAMAALALLVWAVGIDRQARTRTAVAAVLGAAFAVLLLTIAAGLHTDPRPFVQNPSLHPLIKHSADNGFPSDHCIAAGLLTSLLAFRHRRTGVVLAAAAVLLAAARVAAHVHHLQDVVAGLALGALAGWLATVVVDQVAGRWAERAIGRFPADRSAADRSSVG